MGRRSPTGHDLAREFALLVPESKFSPVFSEEHVPAEAEATNPKRMNIARILYNGEADLASEV